jgi:hypothetical protein
MVQLTGIALNDRVNLPFLRKWGWLQPGVVEFEKQGQKRLGKGSPAIRCKPPVEAGFTLLSGLVRGGLCRYHPIPVVSKIPLPKTDGQRPTKAPSHCFSKLANTQKTNSHPYPAGCGRECGTCSAAVLCGDARG